MPRQSLLVLGLLSLALSLGLSARSMAADPPADTAPAAHSETSQGGNAHAATSEHAAEGEAHEKPNILELKPPLAAATLIVFLTLLVVLWKFAWGPLAKALDDRERHHEETLRQAEHARAESERLLAEHRAQMAQAAEQVRSILDHARKDAEMTANSILQKAQSEAEAAKQRAERDIAQARDQALIEIWSKTADLAVSVAGKVLSREIGADEQRRLVDVAMQELPAAPVSANGHGGQA